MAQTLIWIMDDGQTIDVSGTGHMHRRYVNAWAMLESTNTRPR